MTKLVLYYFYKGMLTSMENIQARQRIYQILGKLMRGEDLGLSSQNFTTNNEMVELVELITNNSPFFSMESVQVRYAQVLSGDPNNRGQYIPDENVIEYAIPYLEAIANNRINIMALFDTIFHEQTHRFQEWYRNHSDLVDSIDYKRIIDEMSDVKPTEDELRELNEFANKHKLFGRRLTERQVRVLRFGAYLSNHCEIDARRNAYNSTSKAYEIMINDPLCPPELKAYLTSNFEGYVEYQKKEEAEGVKMMESYKNLEKKVEATLLKIIRSGEKLDNANKTVLLNGMLNRITKSLPLSENLEIAKWALQQDGYSELIKQINLRNNLSFEKRALSHFVTDILSNNILTSANFSDVCTLFSSFAKKDNIDAINYLVLNLVDRAEVKILLENCSIGRIMSSANDRYVSSKVIENAFSIYLSKIETSKNIENYEEYQQIEQEIRNRLNARGLGVNVEETMKLFGPIVARLDRINANKEIKINDEIQQKEMPTIELTEDNVTHFHFTETKFLQDIQENGLEARIGSNAFGVEETKKVFFSEGIDNVAKCIDVWIRWRIVAYNKINTLPKYIEEEFGQPIDMQYYQDHGELSERDVQRYTEAYQRAHDRFKKEIAEGKLSTPEARAYAYEDMYKCWKNRSYLSLDLEEGEDFTRTDISEDKKSAFETDSKDYLRYMYGEYEFDSLQMDTWNMHTKAGQGVDPSKIKGVLAVDGKTDGLSVAKRIYEIIKTKHHDQVDLPDLEKWLAYCHSREISEPRNADKYLENATEEQKGKVPTLTYESREITSADGLRKFSFYGSELDEKLVNAYIKKDAGKIERLVEEGANPNIPITFQSFKETQNKKTEETELKLAEESTLPILSQFIVRNINVQNPEQEIDFINQCILSGARLSTLSNQYVMPEETVEQIQDENIRGHIQEINEVATESAESTKNESNKKRYEYIQQDIIDQVITKNQTAEQPLTLNTPQPAQPTSPNN